VAVLEVKPPPGSRRWFKNLFGLPVSSTHSSFFQAKAMGVVILIVIEIFMCKIDHPGGSTSNGRGWCTVLCHTRPSIQDLCARARDSKGGWAALCPVWTHRAGAEAHPTKYPPPIISAIRFPTGRGATA
jgi:hypothetical protein